MMLCVALIQCLESFLYLFVKGHMLHKDMMVGRNPHFDGSQKYVLRSKNPFNNLECSASPQCCMVLL